MRRFGFVLACVVLVVPGVIACGGGGDSGSSTSAAGPVPEGDPHLAGAIPPAYVVIDGDPASPVSVTVGLAENDDGLRALVILGDKVPTSRPPAGMLFFTEDEAEPFSMTFDSKGRLQRFLTPDGAELRVLAYEGDQATVAVIDPDGAAQVGVVDVPDVDASLLDELAAAAGPTAQPTAYRLRDTGPPRAGEKVTPLAVLVATATGPYTVGLPAELDPADVLLRAGECRIPPIANVPASSSGTYATCQTSIGVDEIVVRSIVDVPALYGGQLPHTLYENVDSCEYHKTAAEAVGVLFLGGAMVAVVVTAFAAVTVTTLAAAALTLGFGTTQSLALGGFGGALLYGANQTDCVEALVTNDGLRIDVQERLAELTATVDYTPVVLREPDRYTATAQPAQLAFTPFVAGTPVALEPVTVSVTPIDEPAPAEPAPAEPAPPGDDIDGIQNGMYVGTVSIGGEIVGPFFQILDSTVELDVTDAEVKIAVGYTVYVSVRAEGTSQEAARSVCDATLRYTYIGQSPPGADLNVVLEAALQEVVSTEGPKCGADPPFDRTAEEVLLSGPPAIPLTLTGSFANGRFDGTLIGNRTPLAVTAGV